MRKSRYEHYLRKTAAGTLHEMAGLRTGIALLVALSAAGTLLLAGPQQAKESHARRGTVPGNLPDGGLFTPVLFLDTDTVLGTAAGADGREVRLLLLDGGTFHELRRVGTASTPEFDDFTTAGNDVAWAESADEGPTRIWAVNTRDGRPPRELTADTGNAVFFGTQNDLVIADGRVHWAAAASAGTTEIRSVALDGGPVAVVREKGEWALSAWPWLTDAAGGPAGVVRLRNMSTAQEISVTVPGGQAAECSPAWCRVMVSDSRGLVRIDLMRPDGTARRRIAGAGFFAATADVALLDRFEILSSAGVESDLTGTAALSVYDIRNGRTAEICPAAGGAFARAGMLWWSTGDSTATIWHSLDLRTS